MSTSSLFARGRSGVCALTLGAVLVTACSASPRATFDEDTSDAGASNGMGGPIGTNPVTGPTAADCEKMDIVFVVDDSGSMGEEQDNLAKNFPEFIKVLDEFKAKNGAAIDYRIAVTTTGRDVNYLDKIPGKPDAQTSEKGDNGAFRNTPTCGATRRWIEKADPDASGVFSCLARVGTKGPAIEMPLHALKLALNDRMKDSTNTGFLRDDALLAVVILTDEDDCSRADDDFVYETAGECVTMPNATPIPEVVTMLDTSAGGAGRWATAVIAGAQQCNSQFGSAVEAKRLKSFVNAAGKNGTFSSICDGDLSGALKQALATFDAACKSFAAVR